MKIALKYGLMITAAIILWVIIAHALVPNPTSKGPQPWGDVILQSG